MPLSSILTIKIQLFIQRLNSYKYKTLYYNILQNTNFLTYFRNFHPNTPKRPLFTTIPRKECNKSDYITIFVGCMRTRARYTQRTHTRERQKNTAETPTTEKSDTETPKEHR